MSSGSGSLRLAPGSVAEGAISDGGVSIQPWTIPHLGSSVGAMGGSQRGIGQMAGGTSVGTSQGLGSTGMGGTFGQASWPGKMAPMWHRGLYGGPGIRTGGYA